MKKLLLLAIATWLFGGWCIVHTTQKKIYDDEDKRFFTNYPLGVIIQKGSWYQFLSGPYSKKEARALLRYIKKRYPTAYIKKCKKVERAKAVHKVLALP